MLGIKLFKKHRRSKKLKIFAVLFAVATILIMTISFFMDDDMYTYYMQKNEGTKGKSIYDMIDSTGRKIYYTANKEKLKSGSRKSSGNSVDASEDEILKAIQEIVGNFDDAWIKGSTGMQPHQVALFKEMIPLAIKCHLQYPNIWTSATLYTKTEESGWYMTGTTPTSNNLMGIKGYGSPTPYWSGNNQASYTGEGEGSGRYYMTDVFRSYANFTDSVMDFGAFLNTEPLYKTGGNHQLGITGDAANCLTATSGIDQSTRIINAGYMSSPTKYKEDLKRYDFCQLTRFDDLADKVQQALSKADSNNTDTADSDSDEWEPSGGGLQKIADAGVDTNSINSKRKKILAEAESLIGTPYVYGGTTVPSKNEDGSYAVKTGGLDCSSFTQHCTLIGTGIDISRTTFTQAVDRHMEAISLEEAKPGDLFQPTISHTTIFLKNNGNGTVMVIHEPKPGFFCTIVPQYNVGSGKFFRLKGIDD